MTLQSLFRAIQNMPDLTRNMLLQEARILPGELDKIINETLEAIEPSEEQIMDIVHDNIERYLSGPFKDLDERDQLAILKETVAACEQLEVEQWNDMFTDLEHDIAVISEHQLKAIGEFKAVFEDAGIGELIAAREN